MLCQEVQIAAELLQCIATNVCCKQRSDALLNRDVLRTLDLYVRSRFILSAADLAALSYTGSSGDATR
jgi:hypothetical protein